MLGQRARGGKSLTRVELAGQDGDAKLLGELLVEGHPLAAAKIQKGQLSALAGRFRHRNLKLVWSY